jgi:hypothetical protein
MRVYPPSFCITKNNLADTGGQWSAWARLLPYVEQGNVYQNINFGQTYDLQPAISSLRVPLLLCPSEIHDAPRLSGGQPKHYPLSYGVNHGEWFIYDPVSNRGGNGVFHPNAPMRQADIRDGLSSTLCAAEVKAYTSYVRDAGAAPASIPFDPSEICPLGGTPKLGPGLDQNSGHTEWVDGRSHQAGFTSVFTPNTQVLCDFGGVLYDIDWTSQREGTSLTVPTFAAVTSRSYHPGVVNVLLMDGSARSVADSVDRIVWRALSTRAGREIVPDEY